MCWHLSEQICVMQNFCAGRLLVSIAAVVIIVSSMAVRSERVSTVLRCCNGIFLTFKHLEMPIGVRQHTGLAMVDVLWLVGG